MKSNKGTLKTIYMGRLNNVTFKKHLIKNLIELFNEYFFIYYFVCKDYKVMNLNRWFRNLDDAFNDIFKIVAENYFFIQNG